MNIETLEQLEQLNQLRLTDEERGQVLAFFERQAAAKQALDALPTENVERMVHVMPLENVLREDVPQKMFDREALQAQAPATSDGYWQVPRVAV